MGRAAVGSGLFRRFVHLGAAANGLARIVVVGCLWGLTHHWLDIESVKDGTAINDWCLQIDVHEEGPLFYSDTRE